MNAYEDRARMRKALKLAVLLRGKVTPAEVRMLPDDAWEHVAVLAGVEVPSVVTRELVAHIFELEAEVRTSLAVVA